MSIFKNTNQADKGKKDFYDTFELYILIFLIVVYVVVDKPKIIGLDAFYYLVVCWLPFLVGTVSFGLFKYKKFRKLYLSEPTEPKKSKWALVGLYLFMSMTFSFFTFNLLSTIVWTKIVEHKSMDNAIEVLPCKITAFTSSKVKHSVKFIFKDKVEYVRIDYKEYYQFKDKPVHDYELVLKTRKSIGDYYIVYDWDIAGIAGKN